MHIINIYQALLIRFFLIHRVGVVLSSGRGQVRNWIYLWHKMIIYIDVKQYFFPWHFSSFPPFIIRMCEALLVWDKRSAFSLGLCEKCIFQWDTDYGLVWGIRTRENDLLTVCGCTNGANREESEVRDLAGKHLLGRVVDWHFRKKLQPKTLDSESEIVEKRFHIVLKRCYFVWSCCRDKQ